MQEIFQHFSIAGGFAGGNIEMLESPVQCGKLGNYVIMIVMKHLFASLIKIKYRKYPKVLYFVNKNVKCTLAHQTFCSCTLEVSSKRAILQSGGTPPPPKIDHAKIHNSVQLPNNS